ncbi:hypothetical protein KBJ98_07710 [Flavobacterium sp. F-328]|uniref:Uncharacterized protein n=1 Tax=Flavobacterium erciyesense TaxID=2825842 RepID=A0ABS5D3J0_9FLAO|nr:hypothetical protein [Flavobacterium erciyesense]MBQ0908583.1 hypothetical protein [Flavobacterium erciyesense]
MKYDIQLKNELIRLAESYGTKNFGDQYAHPNELKNSSVIFNDIRYSFHNESFSNIESKDENFKRTQKKHSRVQTKNAGILEMQSSNSSDALAMNVFCHPDFSNWVEMKKLFQVTEFTSIDFGHKARVDKTINNIKKKDNTEVDVFINGNIFIECKLTEKDFSSKKMEIVEHYSEFRNVFHVEKLLQTKTHYENYQLIRNILAANQHKAQFILICDIRRPDLVESFCQTVACIKDNYLGLRTNCKIIYWQDLAKVVGDELKIFLHEKYGIN